MSLMIGELRCKDLVVLVCFYDLNIMKAVTRFIDLSTANDGTAAAIFSKIDGCFMNHCCEI